MVTWKWLSPDYNLCCWDRKSKVTSGVVPDSRILLKSLTIQGKCNTVGNCVPGLNMPLIGFTHFSLLWITIRQLCWNLFSGLELKTRIMHQRAYPEFNHKMFVLVHGMAASLRWQGTFLMHGMAIWLGLWASLLASGTTEFPQLSHGPGRGSTWPCISGIYMGNEQNQQWNQALDLNEICSNIHLHLHGAGFYWLNFAFYMYQLLINV